MGGKEETHLFLNLQFKPSDKKGREEKVRVPIVINC